MKDIQCVITSVTVHIGLDSIFTLEVMPKDFVGYKSSEWYVCKSGGQYIVDGKRTSSTDLLKMFLLESKDKEIKAVLHPEIREDKEPACIIAAEFTIAKERL